MSGIRNTVRLRQKFALFRCRRIIGLQISAKFFPLLAQVRAKILPEAMRGKPVRLLLDMRGAKSVLLGFKLPNRRGKGFPGLFSEKHPSGVLRRNTCLLTRANYAFSNSTAPIGNHRTPEGERFDRHDSEVLFTRKQEGAAVCILFLQILIANPAAKLHGWARKLS